jgi:hypothetical protein
MSLRRWLLRSISTASLINQNIENIRMFVTALFLYSPRLIRTGPRHVGAPGQVNNLAPLQTDIV